MSDPGDGIAVLEERVRRLEAVVEAGAMVNSTLELERLADHIVSIATELIDAERGSLFLVDPASGVLRSLVAQGVGGVPIEVRAGEGIVGSVAATGQAIILDDPYDDPRFDRAVDLATGFVTRSLLTVPVRDRAGQLTAVLQLLNHRSRRFSSGDVAFLAELAVPFAVALTTARMHRQLVEQERLAEELRMAAEIQRALRPHDVGAVEGLEIEAVIRPCREVGGDYWDVIPRGFNGRWWLVVADVSGKGVSAGLIAAKVQAFLWSRRTSRQPLARVVAALNELLHHLTDGVKYATLVVADWHPSSGWMTWVNAGHPPVLLRRGGRIVQIEATGPPVGMLPEQEYRSRRTLLRPDDTLLLVTDGVLEAGLESEADEFGIEGVEGSLRPGGSCREVVRRLEGALAAHLGATPAGDDVTVVCAQRTGYTGGDHGSHKG